LLEAQAKQAAAVEAANKEAAAKAAAKAKLEEEAAVAAAAKKDARKGQLAEALQKQKVKEEAKFEAEKKAKEASKVEEVKKPQDEAAPNKFVTKEQSKMDTIPVEKSVDQAPKEEKKKEEFSEKVDEVVPENDVKVGSQLKDHKELTGFPVFPEGTKSLLKKYLSRDIWNELKNTKDSNGFSFKKAIFSGCQNTDSGVGVYAGSQDSYRAFGRLFVKIILDYHGHKKSDIHHSDMDYTKLNTPPFSEAESKMIKSTRIRVGRNLADYPLGPGLTKDQRKEIETKVVQALTTFEGDLAGKYYALTSLTEAERK
jgi:chemotaxis protein histidine kinase CheA